MLSLSKTLPAGNNANYDSRSLTRFDSQVWVIEYWSHLLVVFMTKGACAAMSGNPGVHCLLGCWSTTVTSGGGWFSLKGEGWSLASITAELDEKLFVVFESLLLVLITHLGTNWSFALDSVDKGGKSVAKSKWSLAVVDEASKVSSEATELAVLFIVSNDCEGLKAGLRRRLYLRNDVIF